MNDRPTAEHHPGPWITFGTLPITLLIQSAASAALIAPTVAAPLLLATLGASTVVVGVYIAVVYGAAMVSSQWGAALVRRLGPIRTSGLALALCALGLLLVAVPNTACAFVGAILLGAGYGPITPASSEMLARTTPVARLSLVFSVKQTGVPLGGVIAGLVVPAVLTVSNAAWAMVAIAALCVLGLGLGELLRGVLDAHRQREAPWPTLAHLAIPLRFVWAHEILRRLALCTLVFSIVQLAVSSYMVSFLHGDLDWSIVAAGAALSIAQVAAVIGRVFWGLIADRGRDGARRTLFGLALVMLACGLAMPFLDRDLPHVAVIALLSLYAGTGIGWNGVYLATVARVVPRHQAAMATAGSLFFTYFGVLIGSPTFGLASGLFGRIAPAYALLALPLAWTLWTLWRSDWSRGTATA